MIIKLLRFFVVLVFPGAAGMAQVAANPSALAAVPAYVITNDDRPPKVPTSATFFALASDGTPQNPIRVSVGGVGAGGGFFAANRVSVLESSTDACAYLSLGASGEVSAVDIHSLETVGDFFAAPNDSGIDNGVGLANNGTYLYASFSTSNTLATFAVLPGCGLQFLRDIAPVGKHQGNIKGMAVHGNLLIVTYGDGSIESFNIAAGVPDSNGDLQDATGYNTDRYPTGVDITRDGHYAIFGDQASNSTIEVSAISSGKLTKTVLYNLGNAGNSNNVLLSPDETLLYIANTGTGQVTAAFFDATTGRVTPGCTSAELRGFDNQWTFLSSPVTQLTSGTGSVLYVAEFGVPSSIAFVKVTSAAGKCSLKEAPHSPVVAPDSTTLLSIGVYPPRQF